MISNGVMCFQTALFGILLCVINPDISEGNEALSQQVQWGFSDEPLYQTEIDEAEYAESKRIRLAKLDEENATFMIKTGSFTDYVYAERQQLKLEQEGFKAKIYVVVISEKDKYLVQLAEDVPWQKIDDVWSALEKINITPLIKRAP
jgi:cell division protein FtsN